MTQDDLNQIRALVREETRAVVREEIASNNETLSGTLRTEFHDDLAAAVVAIRQDFAERMDAAAVSFGTDFSELRKELGHRIDILDTALGRRMAALEHRMDRVAETTGSIATEIAALTRWANRLDRENLETLNTQAAQQRAISKLLRPPSQPPS
jgi:hypothetical protein